jgi:hypothetical protein
MDKLVEGATAFILGLVATLFITHVMASLEHSAEAPATIEPETRVLH